MDVSQSRQLYNRWIKTIEGRIIKRIKVGEQLGLCPHCLSPLGTDYELDHILPISQGGHPTSIDNLIVICRSCNRQKGKRSIDTTVYSGDSIPKSSPFRDIPIGLAKVCHDLYLELKGHKPMIEIERGRVHFKWLGINPYKLLILTITDNSKSWYMNKEGVETRGELVSTKQVIDQFSLSRP
jgi:hypothetical protein